MAHSRVSPLALIVALAFGPVASAFAQLDDEFEYYCTSKFKESSAYGSCSPITVIQSPKGVCVLSAICDNLEKKGVRSRTTWTLDSMSKLVNNNGVLSGGVDPANNPGW